MAPNAAQLITDLAHSGVSLGLASSSKHTRRILEAVGLVDLFNAHIDGFVSESHLGAMVGTVAIVLLPYLGVELRPAGVRFDPERPSRLRRIRCRIRWRDRWLDVELTMERLRVTPDGHRPEPVPIRVGGDWREVAPGDTFEASIP